MEQENEKLLNDLINLSEKGRIPYTPTQLRKMKPIRREQVLQDYHQKELDEVNEAVADMVVVKFEELMKNFDLIEKDSALARKLQDRNLFMKDVKNVVSYVTPFLPFVGLLEGVLVTSTEVFDHYKNKSKDEADSPKTPEGEEPSETPEDESEYHE